MKVISLMLVVIVLSACGFETTEPPYLVVKTESGITTKIEGDVEFCSVGDTVMIGWLRKRDHPYYSWQLSNCLSCADSTSARFMRAVVIRAYERTDGPNSTENSTSMFSKLKDLLQ